MEILFESDQNVASELPFGQYGRMIVTDAAAAIGITAIPAPAGNPEADWFVHQAMVVRDRFASAVGFDGNFGHHYVIDSKAMRKVGPDSDEVSVFSMTAAVGANITTQGRSLIQLH